MPHRISVLPHMALSNVTYHTEKRSNEPLLIMGPCVISEIPMPMEEPYFFGGGAGADPGRGGGGVLGVKIPSPPSSAMSVHGQTSF